MSFTRGLRKLMVVYAGGAAGGLANSIVVWLFVQYKVTDQLSVNIHPAFTPAWLYPRLVWGGIWGVLFLLPYRNRSVIIRGLLYSLGPSLLQLLYIFPFKQQVGWFGVQLGEWTFLYVLFFNAIWGLVAAVFIVVASEPRNIARRTTATETAE